MTPLQARAEFPALEQKINGHPLVYLDSAATTLKPKVVIEAISNFYAYEAANVHRGAHTLGDNATEKFEATRGSVARLVHAKDAGEIVFTKGTTESINLVVQSWGRRFLRAGDAVILTEMEHHANIVPWQNLADEIGFQIRWIPVTDAGELDFHVYQKLLDKKVKMVSLTFASNTLGTVNDVEKFISAAKSMGAKTLIDAAQAMTIKSVDVQKLNCDFLAFSAHKFYGPFGVGVLYGQSEVLSQMPPYQCGGAMIAEVTKEKTTFLSPPQRFEAGTPNISGVIGFGRAIDFVREISTEKISKHEFELTAHLLERLKALSFVRVIGHSPARVNIVSFVVDGVHSSDIGQLLNQQGVAVRTGHHCTQPLMKRFGITGTVRVSLGVYNNESDVEELIRALKKAREMLV